MKYLHKIQSRYRYSLILLRQMVLTDFKIRYQGSALGYVWSLLRPLFLFVIMYMVFVKFLRIGADTPHYPVYLLTGIVLWNFFAEIASNSVSAVVSQRDLIRKLNFPKYVIILAVAVSALINLALNSIVIGFFMVINHVDIGWSLAWAPLYVFEIFALALSVGFILSAVYVRLRDVNYIWEVFAQALFYATPIIYPLSVVSDKWPAIAKGLLLNPIAQAIQDVRYVAITKQTQTLTGLVHEWYLVAVPFAFVAIVAGIAVLVFKKLSPSFAEEV